MAAPVDAGYGSLTVGNADPIIENSSQVSLHVPRTDYQERIQHRQVEQVVHVLVPQTIEELEQVPKKLPGRAAAQPDVPASELPRPPEYGEQHGFIECSETRQDVGRDVHVNIDNMPKGGDRCPPDLT